MTPPAKLYKYCPFNVFSLRAINEAEIFHASPKQFNDPLDCNPTLDLDVNTDEATRLLRCMLNLSGETPDAIERHINTLRYLATDVCEGERALAPGAEEGEATLVHQKGYPGHLAHGRCRLAEFFPLSETYAFGPDVEPLWRSSSRTLLGI